MTLVAGGVVLVALVAVWRWERTRLVVTTDKIYVVHGTFRRRAVLLVMDANTIDASEVSADRVRRFLESLRVPLFVWSMGAPVGPTAEWADAVDVTSENALRDSYKKLRADLDGQWIVWVEGKVLPQEVTLAPGASTSGIALVP